MNQGQLYSVTVKYELRHRTGELVPLIKDVESAIKKQIEEGDVLIVHTEQEVDEVGIDGFGDPQPTGEKIKHFEGCRVSVDEVEVQEAKTR